MNILVNAAHAIEVHGSIKIKTQCESDDMVVRISDTGKGIAPENLTRIFEPFFTTKEVGKGTGLGLSTVIGIVKSHGGFVTVYSEPGLGTTFNVHLPAAAGTLATVADAATRTLTGHGESILVVDDEAAIRQVLKLALEKENYRVIAAADGREALTLFHANPGSIRLLLTDLMMPVMSGVTLIRLLRAEAPHLRVIAASGLHDEQRRAELTALGVTSILAKPFGTGEVLEAVQRELAPWA
jgi:CheY-like chemotaxis protein